MNFELIILKMSYQQPNPNNPYQTYNQAAWSSQGYYDQS